MVLVNNPGDWRHLYAPLAHAEWHGWTYTDTIFPFFLFICGVSMVLSLRQRAAAGSDRARLLAQSARRALALIGIGLLLNLVPYFDFATVRIPGVLQRIGLCVLLAAPLVIYCGWRTQAVVSVLLLSVYGWIQLTIAVPDAYGVLHQGRLEPGRDVGAFIDRWAMAGHLWARSRTWDPEGLLSTLPALASLLFGVLTGHLFGRPTGVAVRAFGMAAAGLGLLAIGEAVATGMPVNKSLWTPAYALLMTGWALLALAACHWLIDTQSTARWHAWARRLALPFTIYGMNALFIFALSGLIAKLLYTVRWQGTTLKAWLYLPLQSLPLPPQSTSLLFAMGFVAVMFGVAWAMWRRRWFVKV